MKSVRIQHDGGPTWKGLKITDAETGEELQYVTDIDIHMDFKSVPGVTLKMDSPALDITADAEIKGVCPYCGQPTELNLAEIIKTD